MKEMQVLSKISKIRELCYNFIEKELFLAGFDGVLPSHGNIMMQLFRSQEPLAISRIVENVGKAKSTVTSNLHTLEKYGYISRVKNQDDSRSTLIFLTEKGRELIPVFREISKKVITSLYGDMEREERKIFLDSLKKMEININRCNLSLEDN